MSDCISNCAKPGDFVPGPVSLKEKIKELKAENERLKENGNVILMRIQYLLEELGKEATLFLIEQTLKGKKHGKETLS